MRKFKEMASLCRWSVGVIKYRSERLMRMEIRQVCVLFVWFSLV
ncbi:hypothetical protein Hanom_Chr04g00308661 [Helianthus anomalus]